VALYLSGTPLWVQAFLIVVLPTIAAGWGLVLIRRRFGLRRLSVNNEVAGFKFAVVGVIYAVLLAFVVIVVWQKYNDAEFAVTQEAAAAATIYRLADGSDPATADLRNAVTTYLKFVINRDFPEMAREKESPETTAVLNQAYAAAMRLARGGSQPGTAVYEIFYQLDLITQARRNRLHLAVGVVPIVLWHALVLGGIMTVCFTYFFGTPNLGAQVLMTGVLSIIVFMGLFVIVAIDHPFTGPVHVGSGPLLQVLADFAPG
jgi:hypothetical protein